jgi:uncharacterized protein
MGEVKPIWERPLASLNPEEWEALCDGCGKCCLHKLEDEVSGEVFPTNVACKLLDRRMGRCSDYAHRFKTVPDCIKLDLRQLEKMTWLPSTCAYVRRLYDQPLPRWHYLLTGSRDSIHKAKASTRGWTVSEDEAGDLEDHILT